MGDQSTTLALGNFRNSRNSRNTRKNSLNFISFIYYTILPFGGEHENAFASLYRLRELRELRKLASHAKKYNRDAIPRQAPLSRASIHNL
jgi:hypothetical protein